MRIVNKWEITERAVIFMVYVILSVLALVIIYFSIDLTAGDKRKRIITGVVLMLSVLLYPFTFTILLEISPSLETAAILILFHFVLLVTGIIAVIVGLFMKTKRNL